MPPPTEGKPVDGLAPPGVGMPEEPDCPLWPLGPLLPADPCELPLEDCVPLEELDAVCPDCSAGMAPGIPADEDAPEGSALDWVVPVEVDVCGAEPGVDVGMPALGRPLDCREDDELDEDEDDEDELELDELDELVLGIPPEELLDEVAQPASRQATAAASTAARRCGIANWVAERFIAVAP